MILSILKTFIPINFRAVCIIDDDELFEMWLSIEADRIARYTLTFLSNSSLPRVSFDTNPSAEAVLKALAGQDYIDPLSPLDDSQLTVVSIEFVFEWQKNKPNKQKLNDKSE